MNTDSKPLKRYIVLLDKAPFVLFLESVNCLYHSDYFVPALKTFNLSFTDVLVTVQIKPDQDLRKIISATNGLSDPIAYSIIDTLANSIGYSQGVYFHVEPCFKSAKWQEHVVWQNVDDKPEPVIHEYAITVDRITHELHVIYSNDLDSSTETYDGVIALSSININVPFPKALLKECVTDIYEIIKIMSMNREPGTIAKSKYMSVMVMHTGQDVFYWVSIKKIEKDLIAVIKEVGIKIEE